MALRSGTLGTLVFFFFLAVACGSSGGDSMTTDAGHEASASCTQTLADYCGSSCSSFGDSASLCAAGLDFTEDCGGYHVGIDQGVDTQTLLYFAADGSLVAVVHYNANFMERTCIAGADGFTEPDCTGAQRTRVCVLDAGAG